jgi:hypothetical protein
MHKTDQNNIYGQVIHGDPPATSPNGTVNLTFPAILAGLEATKPNSPESV